jgi:DNA-binding IclR family transcriptional regulator
VTLEQLRRRLDEDRVLGLAWSDGFFEAGLSSVAAPIFDATDRCVAALSVSGRTPDFTGPGRREQIGHALREAAEEISRRLGWHPPRQEQAARLGAGQ